MPYPYRLQELDRSNISLVPRYTQQNVGYVSEVEPLLNQNVTQQATPWWQNAIVPAIGAAGTAGTAAIGAQPYSTSGLYGRLADVHTRQRYLPEQAMADKLLGAQMVGFAGQGQRLRTAGNETAAALVDANIAANKAQMFGNINEGYQRRVDQLKSEEESVRERINEIDEANRERKRKAWIQGLVGAGAAGVGIATGNPMLMASGGQQLLGASGYGG